MAQFFQTPPALAHPWHEDAALRAWFQARVPASCRKRWQPGLERLGERAVTEMPVLAQAAERQPPEHVPYDPWGRRIDEIRVSDAWQRLEAIASEEGVVATAYERADGPWSRVHQFLRLYLYHPTSAICSCPMAMTDGAARVLELHADESLRERVLPHLLSRDPDSFWTSGQWMTERSGGSDVSGSETEAVAQEGDDDGGDGGEFGLHGVKWFTSATTSRMAMTLARVRVREDDELDDRLSLFFVETRDEETGLLRGIRVNRLKDKLGTRALPTAELTLEGTPARMVGERGRGVATISSILNITRLYNACCAAGYLGHGLRLATDYARKRVAFGRPLIDQPLHRETLADLATEHQAAFQLVFECARLLGREECGEASDKEKTLLRLLTPVAKLYTAKQAVAGCSEVLECFGGAGYVEDTGLPALLRDAQVLSIWEGTTNVLSLDLLRALGQRGEDGQPWAVMMAVLSERLAAVDAPVAQKTLLGGALTDLSTLPRDWLSEGEAHLQANARQLAYRLGAVVGGLLLLEQADMDDDMHRSRQAAVAARWLRQKLEEGFHAHPSGEASRILDLDTE